MNDRTFYLVLLVMVVSIWALAKVAGFLVRARAAAIDLLDCGCLRAEVGVIYGCIYCGDERCEQHRQALCCQARIDGAWKETAG